MVSTIIKQRHIVSLPWNRRFVYEFRRLAFSTIHYGIAVPLMMFAFIFYSLGTLALYLSNKLAFICWRHNKEIK